jgi:acetyl esterase
MVPDDLDPDIRLFQRRLAAAYAEHPPLDSVSPDQARAIVEAVRAPLTQGGPVMAHSHDIELPVPGHPAVRVRVHRPTVGSQVHHPDAAQPALVYLHGGGWVYFSVDTHDRLMREYAARAGRVVIGVDYARAPEARFPVALEQCVAVLRCLQADAGSVGAAGIDPARIVVAGDSVGANLALAAALVFRDAGETPALQGLLLNYGVYSDDDSGASFRLFDGPRYTLGRDEMRGFWQGYLRRPADADDPQAQPLRGRLDGLPPSLLVVADNDVLRDGNLQLATRLTQAGGSVTLRRYAGATHSFLEAMSFAAISQRALADSAAWLRDLDGAPS